MKGLVFALLVSLSFVVQADSREVTCKRTGYTDEPENFHLMRVREKETTFIIEPGYVQLGDVTYDAIPPDIFDLDGIAITYFDPEERAVLYLYVNDLGRKEIGISNVEMDTDSFFKDKRVFTECSFENTGGSQNDASKQAYRVEEG